MKGNQENRTKKPKIAGAAHHDEEIQFDVVVDVGTHDGTGDHSRLAMIVDVEDSGGDACSSLVIEGVTENDRSVRMLGYRMLMDGPQAFLQPLTQSRALDVAPDVTVKP